MNAYNLYYHETIIKKLFYDKKIDLNFIEMYDRLLEKFQFYKGQTYSIKNYIYSVDMMIAYINIFKPKIINVPVDNLLKNLNKKSWGNTKKGIYYTPNNVITNPQKYRKEYKRVMKADLQYPIIIVDNIVIDGLHRLSKAVITNIDNINVYRFTKTDMLKFLINSQNDWNYIDNLEIYDIIYLFYKKFNVSKFPTFF